MEDPTDFWDSMWRNPEVPLCEARTVLSPIEHAYVMTRDHLTAPPLVRAENGATPEVWCPLHEGHDGAHVAFIAWAGARHFEDHPSGWFMEWGPSDADRRWQGHKRACGAELTHSDGTIWHCRLNFEHFGECRRSIQVVTEDDDWDLDLSADEEYDEAETTKWLHGHLVETYLKGEVTYRDLAGEWYMKTREVEKIIRASTTKELRDETDALRERLRFNGERAEQAWREAEKARRASAYGMQFAQSILDDLAQRLHQFNPAVVENGVVVPLHGAGRVMAALAPSSLTVRLKMDHMDDWESFSTFDFDSQESASKAVEGAAMMMRYAYEDGAPIASEEVDVLNELAGLLSDLNPVVTVNDQDAWLAVAHDSEAKVVVSVFDHELDVGTEFAIGEWQGSDSLESMELGETQRAADLVRATLAEMPELKKEFVEDSAEMEDED